jgi:hypothetical protein
MLEWRRLDPELGLRYRLIGDHSGIAYALYLLII